MFMIVACVGVFTVGRAWCRCCIDDNNSDISMAILGRLCSLGGTGCQMRADVYCASSNKPKRMSLTDGECSEK